MNDASNDFEMESLVTCQMRQYGVIYKENSVKRYGCSPGIKIESLFASIGFILGLVFVRK